MLTTAIPRFEILRTGYYRHTVMRTQKRIVDSYIIELFRIPSGSMNIEGHGFELVPDLVTFTHPGQRRSSVAPFECWFVHFHVQDDGSYMRGFDSIPNMFMLSGGADEMIRMFSALRRDFVREDSQAAGAQLAEILCALRVAADAEFGGRHAASPSERAAVEGAEAFIREHFSENIRLCDIAAAVHLSPGYLHAVFRRVTGETPAGMLSRMRMEKAVELLFLDMSIARIAEQCGFESQTYFSYAFKKRFGTTPRQYRERGI